MAFTLERIREILNKASSELLETIELGPHFYAKLKSRGVITKDLDNQLKVTTLSGMERISILLDSIGRGPIHRFLNFCDLLNKERPDILDIMKVDIKHIRSQLDKERLEVDGSKANHSALDGPALNVSTLTQNTAADECSTGGIPNENALMFPHLVNQYIEHLGKCPVYEYTTRSPNFDVDEVFTKLQIYNNKNDQVSFKQERKTGMSIDVKDVFKKKADSDFLRIILEGEPGSGKTAFLKHCAVTWAKSRAKLLSEEEEKENQGNEILQKELVVFLNKDNEKESLEETIKHALRIEKGAFEYSKEHPEKTFLLIDNLDDFTNEKVVTEITELSEQTMTVLVSCRVNHPYLEKKMSNFNRQLRVTGFEQSDVQKYVPKFINALHCDSPVVSEIKEEKIKSLCNFLNISNEKKMYAIPMNCAFLCQLYYENEISAEELKSLTVDKLYKKQQDFTLKRECIKRVKTDNEAERLVQQAKSSVEGIHRMALHSFLYKQSGYSSEKVEQFGIDLDSPAMVLLQKKNEKLGTVFSWPHKSIRAFHAVCAATAAAASYDGIWHCIASRTEHAKVLLELLLNTSSQEVAKNLFTAMLIMNLPDPPCLMERSSLPISRATEREAHVCLQIREFKKTLAQNKLDELLLKPFTEKGVIEPHLQLKILEIQEYARESFWFFNNLDVLEKLCEKTLNTSVEKWTELLAGAIHPFLTDKPVFKGSLTELKHKHKRFNQLKYHGEDAEPNWFHKIVLKRFCKVKVCMLPTTGTVPWIIFLYCYCGKMVVRSLRVLRLSDITKPILVVFHPNIKDICNCLENADIKNFSLGHRGIDWVRIDTESDVFTNTAFTSEESKENLSVSWGDATVKVHEKFKPRCGIMVKTTVLDMDQLKELTRQKIEVKVEGE